MGAALDGGNRTSAQAGLGVAERQERALRRCAGIRVERTGAIMSKKKKAAKEKEVEVNEQGSKREVIVRHRDERLRILCDDDGIHVGTIVKAAG